MLLVQWLLGSCVGSVFWLPVFPPFWLMLNDDSDLLLFCLIPHLMSDPEGDSISLIREHGAAKVNASSISPIWEHGAAKGNASISILAFLLGYCGGKIFFCAVVLLLLFECNVCWWFWYFIFYLCTAFCFGANHCQCSWCSGCLVPALVVFSDCLSSLLFG